MQRKSILIEIWYHVDDIWLSNFLLKFCHKLENVSSVCRLGRLIQLCKYILACDQTNFITREANLGSRPRSIFIIETCFRWWRPLLQCFSVDLRFQFTRTLKVQKYTIYVYLVWLQLFFKINVSVSNNVCFKGMPTSFPNTVFYFHAWMFSGLRLLQGLNIHILVFIIIQREGTL